MSEVYVLCGRDGKPISVHGSHQGAAARMSRFVPMDQSLMTIENFDVLDETENGLFERIIDAAIDAFDGGDDDGRQEGSTEQVAQAPEGVRRVAPEGLQQVEGGADQQRAGQRDDQPSQA